MILRITKSNNFYTAVCEEIGMWITLRVMHKIQFKKMKLIFHFS